MKEPTLFSDFLEALEVPHTVAYSNRRYRCMPFPTLFGLSKLLKEYGVDSEGYALSDKSEIAKLPVPFLAKMPKGMVIVTAVTPDTVSYQTAGVCENAPLGDFTAAWTGTAFIAYPTAEASEPDYAKNRLLEQLDQAKTWVLALAAIFLFLYFFIRGGLYAHVSAWFVVLFDLAGLFFTFHLVQKSLNIKSKVGDRVCGVLEKGGCDSVLKTPAAKFFGLFGWSEVGLAYFGVSLLTLLLFPQAMGILAVCNALCLPFSFWSIWYQKTRAKAWCTLCVSVQCTLWLLFFSYLLGGWYVRPFVAPGFWGFVALGAAYVAALLGLNRLMPLIEKTNPENQDETVTAA